MPSPLVMSGSAGFVTTENMFTGDMPSHIDADQELALGLDAAAAQPSVPASVAEQHEGDEHVEEFEQELQTLVDKVWTCVICKKSSPDLIFKTNTSLEREFSK